MDKIRTKIITPLRLKLDVIPAAGRQVVYWMAVFGVANWATVAALPCPGQQPPTDLKLPLIEQPPFDLIQLDELNGHVEIKIKPLIQPLDDPLPTQGFLLFESPDLSDERLQVPFSNIVTYKSYNDLLRAEANQYIRQEEYGKAFRNLIYVFDHGGQDDSELSSLIQNLLFRDGAKNYLAGNFELALSIFQDIYRRDPNFTAPGIGKKPIDLILECLDKNIESQYVAGRFDQVRAAIDELEFRYPDAGVQLVDKWRTRLLEQSDRLLQEARQLADAGDGKLAQLAVRRADTIVPGRIETQQLSFRLQQQFPVVFVGVRELGANPDPLRLDHWSARRVGRLTRRSVVEFAGPGDEGGHYEFLNGTIQQLDDQGLIFQFQIDPARSDQAIPTIDAFQLSRRLLARGSVYSEEYYQPFARVVKTIEIVNEYSVLVTLKRAFVKPEALWRFSYHPPGSPGSSTQEDGLYSLAERNQQISIYQPNPIHHASADLPRLQIVESKFESATQAVKALINGEIDLVDRVHLADLDRLREHAAIEIGSYLVPTVHLLVPHERNEFMRDRSFRNGLKHGINRERILREVICGGREIDGCEVISGPFPIGTEENDQVSYAYNLGVSAEPFNDRLGMVLVRVVYETQRNSLLKQGIENPQLEFPTIVLAYPDDEIAEMTCVNISQMWEGLGLSVTLRPLEEELTVPPDQDWDFLYFQLAMQEPLTDVEWLFGIRGIVKSISAPVQQNMHLLGTVENWRDAAKTLRLLHRQVVNDVSIIPLWQLKEHFAYREHLQGLRKSVVHLYEDAGRWRIGNDFEVN